MTSSCTLSIKPDNCFIFPIIHAYRAPVMFADSQFYFGHFESTLFSEVIFIPPLCQLKKLNSSSLHAAFFICYFWSACSCLFVYSVE